MIRLSRTLFPALFVLAALPLAAPPAEAQTIRSPLRYIEERQGLSFYGGYLFTESELTLNDSTRADLGPQSAPIFGARYQLRISGPISGTVGVAYAPSERKLLLAEAVNDSTAIRVIDTGNTAPSRIVMAELGLTFSLTGPRAWNGLAPFVGISAGLAQEIGRITADEEEVPEPEQFDFGPSFALGLRAGTDFFVTRNAALRLEVNPRLWRQSAPQGFRRQGQQGISEWNNASSVQLGGAFYF